MDIVDKAIMFAVKAHSGDVRKGTDIPYIVHPIESCAIVASITDDKEIIAAAVLHDVVEDSDYTKEDLLKYIIKAADAAFVNPYEVTTIK